MKLHDGTVLVLPALLVVACASRPAPPPAGWPAPVCSDGPPVCGVDRASVVQCQRGQWALLQRCDGPGGCSFASAIQCDTGAARAAAFAPCTVEGGYDCTSDRRAMTSCRGGRAVVVSTCRGTRGCSVGNAVDCDHSIAALGDPCDGPKEIACSTDFKQLLRCAGGVYQVGESCRNACLSTSGRVLCQ